MTNITRFDPFDVTLEPFDDLLQKLFPPSTLRRPATANANQDGREG